MSYIHTSMAPPALIAAVNAWVATSTTQSRTAGGGGQVTRSYPVAWALQEDFLFAGKSRLRPKFVMHNMKGFSSGRHQAAIRLLTTIQLRETLPTMGPPAPLDYIVNQLSLLGIPDVMSLSSL
jgi:hypothetical protein